jgi:hypothetical protein
MDLDVAGLPVHALKEYTRRILRLGPVFEASRADAGSYPMGSVPSLRIST